MLEQMILLTFSVFFATAVTLAVVALNTLWISLVLGYIFYRWADDKHPIEPHTSVDTGTRKEPVKPEEQMVSEEEVQDMMKDKEWQALFNL